MISPSKVTASHLTRNAFLYVRQSSLRQVQDNQESTRRQYALRDRATALGWPADQIEIIDCDLGMSGASAVGREGFQRLVAEVGLGHAGIVLGLEVSRLARNSSDWHRLLEICALTATLILDEDGLYDPAQYNDRLLLGLKGTMSEAELHMLRSRLIGGLLTKAHRGELKICLPIGLVYDATDRVVLHPDIQVRESIALLFQTFQRTGSVGGAVKAYFANKLLFPCQRTRRHLDLEVNWRPLSLAQAASVLHNPAYAGAYAYGRRNCRGLPGARQRKQKLPREEWTVLLLDQHPGYIDWAEFERNQQRLTENSNRNLTGARSPPREGPALLQGLTRCGKCGASMSVTYHQTKLTLVPYYFCVREDLRLGRTCQSVAGKDLDEAIGQLVVEAMSPMALQLSLAIQDEIQSRIDEAERLRQRQVQRASYEVERARQRYMQVDPANRLVASTLEADWNQALRTLEQASDEAERQRQADQARFDNPTQQRILALAADFPAIWADPRTPQRERKRMLALLIEDVTLLCDEKITAHVRFRGGATTTLILPRSLGRRSHPDVVSRTDVLLAEHTDGEVAALLNEEGHVTGAGDPFNATAVAWLRKAHSLASLKERLIAAGGLTGAQLAPLLGIRVADLRTRAQWGQTVARRSNDKGERIFRPLSEQPPALRQLAQRGLSHNEQTPNIASHVGGAV